MHRTENSESSAPRPRFSTWSFYSKVLPSVNLEEHYPAMPLEVKWESRNGHTWRFWRSCHAKFKCKEERKDLGAQSFGLEARSLGDPDKSPDCWSSSPVLSLSSWCPSFEMFRTKSSLSNTSLTKNASYRDQNQIQKEEMEIKSKKQVSRHFKTQTLISCTFSKRESCEPP